MPREEGKAAASYPMSATRLKAQDNVDFYEKTFERPRKDFPLMTFPEGISPPFRSTNIHSKLSGRRQEKKVK
jgi:hypothetical protein